MAVPNTTTFTLQNVVNEVNPTTDDLVDCFSDANPADFDPAYEGSKNSLLNFRNYGAAPPPSNTLTISPTSQAVSQPAGGFTITVTSNTSWAYSDNQTWIAGTPTSGSGNGSISVTYTSNPGSTERFAIIEVDTTSGSPSITRTCVVEQQGTGGGGA